MTSKVHIPNKKDNFEIKRTNNKAYDTSTANRDTVAYGNISCHFRKVVELEIIIKQIIL